MDLREEPGTVIASVSIYGWPPIGYVNIGDDPKKNPRSVDVTVAAPTVVVVHAGFANNRGGTEDRGPSVIRITSSPASAFIRAWSLRADGSLMLDLKRSLRPNESLGLLIKYWKKSWIEQFTRTHIETPEIQLQYAVRDAEETLNNSGGGIVEVSRPTLERLLDFSKKFVAKEEK